MVFANRPEESGELKSRNVIKSTIHSHEDIPLQDHDRDELQRLGKKQVLRVGSPETTAIYSPMAIKLTCHTLQAKFRFYVSSRVQLHRAYNLGRRIDPLFNRT